MNKTKLVCLDVDGTLVDGVSWLLLTEGLGCSPQEHLDIFHQAKNGEISFIEGERMLTKMYQDSGNATETFIRGIFKKVGLRVEAESLVTYLKRKNYLVYLISGAIDIYVEEVAKKLKVNGFYANSTLEFDRNGVLQKIHYRDNQGEVKVEQLKKIIEKLGLAMNEVVFVGDSDNDIEVFMKTKRGIAVHSFNEELKNAAWKTVESLNDIKKIL